MAFDACCDARLAAPIANVTGAELKEAGISQDTMAVRYYGRKQICRKTKIVQEGWIHGTVSLNLSDWSAVACTDNTTAGTMLATVATTADLLPDVSVDESPGQCPQTIRHGEEHMFGHP